QQLDDLTYLFKLRPGVKWHNIAPVNGRGLVADDLIYSYQRIRDLKAPSAGLLTGISKMEAVDPTTLKLTLDKPNADLLDHLANYNMLIVAKEAVAVNGDLKEGPTVGTGPFMLQEFVVNARVVTRRNPDYFLKGLPYLDGVTAFRTADPSAPGNAFRAGTLN